MPNLIPAPDSNPSFLHFCSLVTTSLGAQLSKAANDQSKKASIIKANHRILERLVKQNLPLQELNDLMVWRVSDESPLCGLFDPNLVAPNYRVARASFNPGFRLFHYEIKEHQKQLQADLNQNPTLGGPFSPSQISFIIGALLSKRTFDPDFTTMVNMVNQNGFTPAQLETTIRKTEKFFRKNQFGALPYHGNNTTPAMIYLVNRDACGQELSKLARLPSGLFLTRIPGKPLENLHENTKGTM